MKDKISLKAINILSVVIPLIVMGLLGIRSKPDLGTWTKVLPHIIAIINSLTCVLLVTGFILIRLKKRAFHRVVMSSAFVLGTIFLVCYILYHVSNPPTKYGGQGFVKALYYFVLISHIVLSLVVLPLVLRAYFFAFKKDFLRHKKLVKFAFPIWLYVSISGVIAYLMITPYYVK